jgi:N-acetylneuraminic acid mutarotase
MAHARGALGLVAHDGALYAIGGRDGNAQIAPTERFDPARNAWTARAPMPGPRNHIAAYVDGTRLCAAGGRRPNTTDRIDCYDPATDSWSADGTLPAATSGAAGAVLGNRLVIVGGELSPEAAMVPVIQRRQAGTWTREALTGARHGTAFAIYRGRVWMCGGATAPGFQAVTSCTSLGG